MNNGCLGTHYSFIPMRTHYQYIIIGAGCAGLQLADALLKETSLNTSSILIVEANPHHEPKTRCFWQQSDHPFQHLVKKTWNKIAFGAPGIAVASTLNNLSYQYISSTDFYSHQMELLQQDARVDIVYEKANAIACINDIPQVSLDAGIITADNIFYSYPIGEPMLTPPLWQHFLGWEIETTEPVFAEDTATMMDFSLTHNRDAVFFHYLLPFSTTTALVECTFFSAELVDRSVYEALLSQYIEQYIRVPFTIRAKEEGKIPMALTANNFAIGSGKIIPIGTAAGCIKASTGYSFTRCMKHTQQIIRWLKSGSPMQIPLSSKRFLFYDRLFLSLIQQYPSRMPGIFAALFKNNPVNTILQFLDEDTSLWQEALIFLRLPKTYFLKVLLNTKR